MSLKFPVTKQSVRNHFHYSVWKYLLLVVLAVFGWNLLYTTTRYRPPENLKVEFYVDGYATSAQEDPLQTLLDQVHAELMPEMEEVSYTPMTLDDTYGDMQLLVWTAAGQGDVYLLSRDRYKSLASEGGMLDLQPFIDDGSLHVDGLDLSKGIVAEDETGRKMLCGIPADTLTGFHELNIATDKNVLCILAANGNDAYAVKLLDYFVTHMRAEEEPVAAVAP